MTRRSEDELMAIAKDVLTEKQLKVLGYWAAGHSTRRIALALDIHEATVRGHLAAAFRRMKPHLRKDAA
jgi:DNA-binding CsgD family transcriptional regulator